MKRIGITGQGGFIGMHLFNTVSLLKEQFEIIQFEKEFFNSAGKLSQWITQCDVVVHLAAINRHESQQFIYDTNVSLVEKLIVALELSGSKPHVIFSSSIQEEKNNQYSESKRRGRLMLADWAAESGAAFTGVIIPNVFGSFCKPFYNSFVATFCYQLCNGLVPRIDNDSEVKLIYVNELMKALLKIISQQKKDDALIIDSTSTCNVSFVLEKLTGFKNTYFDQGIFPVLETPFMVNLFNTFRSYINFKNYFPYKFKQNKDARGAFIELARINIPGQVSYSTTYPGIVRGNHFHTRKIERFMVIKGKALIQLRKYNTEEVFDFELDGNEPSYVDMPVWYIHNIRNTGTEELYTVFWINEFYDPADPDTYFETV